MSIWNHDIVFSSFDVTSLIDIWKPAVSGERIVFNKETASSILSKKDVEKIASGGIRLIYAK